MKKLTTFIALLIAGICHAQTFWAEDFGTAACTSILANAYSGVNGTWTVTVTGVEGANPNPWYVSAIEAGMGVGNCGNGCQALPGVTNQTLHVGSNPVTGQGDLGAVYDAGGLCGIISCPQTDRRAASPIIDCSAYSSITLSFEYIMGGDTGNDFGQVEYSTNGGATWTALPPLAITSPCGGGNGLWAATTIALPAACNNNPNVKIGFRWINNDDGIGSDPSFAINNVVLSTGVSSLSTGTVAGSPFCACNTMNVPYFSTGTFISGNIFTVELSDASGSFSSPVTIGTDTSIANSGTIACTVPCGTPSGTGYRVRVVSSTPAFTAIDNGVNLTINTNVTPVATASPGANPICAGTTVTFFAGNINGGSSPQYQWQVNGVNITGATTGTYTTNLINNGDVVTVQLTSNAPCAVPTIVTSAGITMVVIHVTPTVTVVTIPSGPVTCGTLVVFTATPTNGGTTPSYQWQINGTNVGGAISSVFTSSTLANHDSVTVVMTSSSSCAAPTTATSNIIVMNVNPIATPTISSSGSIVACVGGSVTLNASTIAGGNYLWNTSQTTQSITVTSSGTYTVTEGNGNPACNATSAPYYLGTTSAIIPLCLVTVDSSSTGNLVIWEKTGVGADIDSFRVYREVMTNVYSNIASVANDTFHYSLYYDYGANPNITSYKYKLATHDTCGGVSALSNYHNTIHLQNLGLGNLQWTLYDIETLGNPVTYYIVNRDDNNTGNFLPISSTIPGTNYTFTDINYSSFPNAAYRLEVAWGISCTPTRSVTTTSSNIVHNGITTAVSDMKSDNSISIYPNPFTSTTTITFAEEQKNTSIKIMDVLGKEIMNDKLLIINGRTVTLDMSNVAKGIYFVQITDEKKKCINKKIIVQ